MMLSVHRVEGAECAQRLGDVWYALDALWRTAQFVHLVAATFDALWQVSWK